MVDLRASAALKLFFVGDAVAMPVHWYYNVSDITVAFPGGLKRLEAPPRFHPTSIMRLHSTGQGGRGDQSGDIVGSVILKGKRDRWNVKGCHYHDAMPAGSNTLNSHCARLLLRHLANGAELDCDAYLQAYIRFMTADPPQHPDTYAESYHRGFFANLQRGLPPRQCGAATHDTASIGAFASAGVLALVLLARDAADVPAVQHTVADFLALTHPGDKLRRACDVFVELLASLLRRSEDQGVREIVAAAGSRLGLDLVGLVASAKADTDVVGGVFSPACYIDGSFPAVLYFLYKYADDSADVALLANANVGGDNCHRGNVLGLLLGLAQTGTQAGTQADTSLFGQLVDAAALTEEIAAALAH